jgi:hypothetical protein
MAVFPLSRFEPTCSLTRYLGIPSLAESHLQWDRPSTSRGTYTTWAIDGGCRSRRLINDLIFPLSTPVYSLKSYSDAEVASSNRWLRCCGESAAVIAIRVDIARKTSGAYRCLLIGFRALVAGVPFCRRRHIGESENVLPTASHAMPSSKSDQNKSYRNFWRHNKKVICTEYRFMISSWYVGRQEVIDVSHHIDPFRWGNV